MSLLPRAILGRRGSELGAFVSPPGVDASTALPSELLLHITSATAQIAMQGIIAGPFPRVVPHILGYAPIIFPNLISVKLVAGFPYVRPFDNTYPPYTNTNVKSEASQFTFSQTGPVLDINYFVYNRPMP